MTIQQIINMIRATIDKVRLFLTENDRDNAIRIEEKNRKDNIIKFETKSEQ